MSIPVYLYMGMLEGGKTTQIQKDVEKNTFKKYRKILLIQCEDGVVQLEETYLRQHNIERVFILNPHDYTREKLASLVNTFHPDGVILECQGIWPLSITVRAFPHGWDLQNATYCGNALEFEQEYKNMDRLIAEKIRFCRKLLFHSATEGSQKNLNAIIALLGKETEVYFRG